MNIRTDNTKDTTMATNETIKHAEFCLPRPGEGEPRIETFRADRTGADGITVVARPVVTRCIECGAQQIVDG